MQAHGFAGGGASFGGAHFSGGHVAPAPIYHAAPNYATYNRSVVAHPFARNHALAYSQRNIAAANRAHNIPSNWGNHVFAHHSASWHRDWDRNRDHWWNGHRCRFVNGSWVIFDVGFDPWWPCSDYYYGYPCDDYGY
jgi:hypothetical protein